MNPTTKRTVRRKGPKLLRDEERCLLLYGPYTTPRPYRGFLVDAVRGKVRFGSFSNALIPWPIAKKQGKGGRGGFILCGDLVRALETESAPAICRHWGVSKGAVSNWRRALGMKGRTAGAQRLVNLGVELARLPESRKKISDAARGRVLSAAGKSKLFAGIRRGWRERFKARRSAYRRTGRFPKATKSDPWIPEEEKLLPKLTTTELARVLGRTRQSIQARRLALGLRPRLPADRQLWREEETSLLGTAPDDTIARRLRRSVCSVRRKRYKLGLRSFGRQVTRADRRE